MITVTIELPTFNKIIDVLQDAESFITGFEDAEEQEGIPDQLNRLRQLLGELNPPT
jgi:hypothetical protein